MKIKFNFNVEVPNRSLWSVLVFVLLCVFGYVQFVGFLIPSFKEMFSQTPQTINISHVGLIWVPLIAYGLVAVITCLLVNIFRTLKTPDEYGLCSGMIAGFTVGIVIAIICGFVLGILHGVLINGKGFFWGLYIGFFVGITAGLIIGYVRGLFFGIREEAQ